MEKSRRVSIFLLVRSLLNWSVTPDIAAIGALVCAFISVVRRNQIRVSRLWFLAWLTILFHFVAQLGLSLPGFAGQAAAYLSLESLAVASLLFMYATVPMRNTWQSRMFCCLLIALHSSYLLAVVAEWNQLRMLIAPLYGVLPLACTLATIRKVNHPRRWMVVGIFMALSIYLMAVQNRPNGADLAINGLLFSAYFGCGIHFLISYRRASAGSFITIGGFFAWASVFVVGPLIDAYAHGIHMENEVWNLPKYVVAVGMILILLEDQIQHNQHLALHDALTGLPNRRLFQDRLASAIERARRTNTQTALLLVDLDRFKQVNDTMGHHVGDLLLQQVGASLLGRVRRSDTVARTGGDEFSIILEEPTNRAEAEQVSHDLLQILSCPMDLEGHRVRIEASIGIALFPDDAQSLEPLCISADLRMYEQKRLSRAKAHPQEAQPEPRILSTQPS